MMLIKRQQPFIAVLILTFLLTSILYPAKSAAAADLSSSYDALKNTSEGLECIERLKSGGASDTQIESFMDSLNTEVQSSKYGTLTESNFNSVMYQALQEVIDNRSNRAVFQAITTQFATEISYTLKNKELAPSLLPLRDAVKDSVLGSGTTSGENSQNNNNNTSGTTTTTPNSTGTSTTGTTNANSTAGIISADAADQSVKNQLTQKLSEITFNLSGATQILKLSAQTLNTLKTEKKEVLIKVSGVTVQLPPGALELTSGNALSLGVAAAAPAGDASDSATFSSKIYEIAGSTKSSLDKVYFDKQVTIELPYEDSKIEQNQILDACYYNEEIGIWIPMNGVADTAKKVVRFQTTHFSKYAVMKVNKTVGLSDLTGHWAAANVNRLVGMKVINGYPNGTFNPEAGITRAEFASILVKAFKLQAKSDKVFSDTNNHWACTNIATAYGNGIISGYDASHFGPDDLITREQMASMVVKAAKTQTQAGNLQFTDSVKIAPWARASVLSAVNNGLIYGYLDGSFKPQGRATRAEAATIIAKTLLK